MRQGIKLHIVTYMYMYRLQESEETEPAAIARHVHNMKARAIA